MSPLPELKVEGTTFVLTGRMWKPRAQIAEDIKMHGGDVATRMKPDYVLVMASALLVRNASTGKWSTWGKAPIKAEEAIRTGALVYHEQMLRDALEGNGTSKATRVSGLHADVVGPPETIPKPVPVWDDEMQAKLEANLRETSELLASFQ